MPILNTHALSMAQACVAKRLVRSADPSERKQSPRPDTANYVAIN